MKRQEQFLVIQDVNNYKGFKKAKELELRINGIVRNFPNSEKYIIVDQITRASRDICKDISSAEQQYVRVKFAHYSAAIGGCKELATFMDISRRQEYITQQTYDELYGLSNQVVAILTMTLRNIKENEGKDMDLPSPYTPDIQKYEVHNKSLLLTDMVYDTTTGKEFWKEKNLFLKIRKAATSVSANISESNQLYVRRKFKFLNNALEALKGLRSLLQTARDSHYISEGSYAEMEEMCLIIEKGIKTTLGNISKEK